MPSLLVHIGAHKTGTTAIQKSCHSGRRALARAGVIYPRCNWYHYAQHRLAFAMRGMRDPDSDAVPDLEQELAALQAAIAAAPETARILISSEEFFAAPPAAIARFHAALDGLPTRILAVTRRPDALFLSMYNQNVKSPQNKFQRRIEAFLDDPLKLHRDMNQRGCVENWANTFGDDAILLRRYEDAPPLEMLLAALDLPADLLPAPAPVNRSVPAEVAEIMRLSKANGIAPELRQDLYRLASEVFADGAEMALPAAARADMLARLAPDLDALFARFGMENTYHPAPVADAPPDPPAPRPIPVLARMLEHLLRARREF